MSLVIVGTTFLFSFLKNFTSEIISSTIQSIIMNQKNLIKLLLAIAVLISQHVVAQVSSATLQQIQSLLLEKNSRTPTQRKIDSRLLQAVRERRGEKMAANVSLEAANVEADLSGVLKVDIQAEITDAFLAKLTASGAKIIYASQRYNTVRALVNLKAVETIAGYSEVKFVEPAVKSIVVDAGTGVTGSGILRTGRIANVRAQLTAYLTKLHPLIGSVTSEGDVTHRATDVRSTYGFLGQGIKIGVLSDSYNATGGAASNVTSGDLPGTGNPDGYTTPVTVVQDYSGGSDEGRAMLQVIHDLAPAATLYFATADVSEASFAANIQTLRNTYGCNIIVDDVFYFDEPAFQDGIVAQAVNTVTASGALYFSSAGNSGALAKGTSGVFEGDFNDAGSPAFSGGSKAGTIHNFGTVASPVNGDIIKSTGYAYNLNWSDPWGASGNDYDLFLVSASGTVKASSTNVQNGSQNPYEQISPRTLVNGDRLIVFKTTGAAVRAFHLNTNRGTLTVVTNGQTTGHACAADAFCMAATPASTAFSSGYPTGPYPNPFVSTNKVEPFSSDGPRRIFYNPDGTAITPGNVLFGTNGGTSRSKPDLTAADGVKTTFASSTGFNPFFGTSCAAPHAGAIAALLLSGNLSLTTAQVRTILTSTALDVEGAGYDINSGFGIVQAFQAAGQVSTGNTCPVPSGLSSSSVTSTSATVSWSTATGATAYNLQYKVSTASTWTTVSNITGTSYGLTGLTASTTYNYQVQSVCSGSTTSAYSSSASFTTSGSGVTYCTTQGSTTHEYINKVAIGTINNTSGNNNGYGDYTSLSTNLAAGSSASITLTPGFTGTSRAEYWRVFIDYNHNGTLNDAGEMITAGNGKGGVTASFTVPSTAKSGTTRMRIIMHYRNALTNPCGTFTNGEAEDYTVNITGGALNSIASVSRVDINSLNSLLVIPNPVKGSSANLLLQVAKAGAVNIKITDLTGRILRVETISSIIAGKNNYSLNSLELIPGTYMIIAEQSNNIIARSQFIVAR
jgi:hypothetical protein